MHIGAGVLKMQRMLKWDIFGDTVYIYHVIGSMLD